MATRLLPVLAAVLALAGGACVHQTEAPPLAGPSGLALSLSVTATPDSVNRDGSSQSAIKVSAYDANGRARSGLSIRMDMEVGGKQQDFGTLSSRTIVTGADGSATTVYTAPGPPPPAAGGGTTIVTVVATPTGVDAQASHSWGVDIRLVTPGVILPPADTPTAAFTVSPTPVSVNVTANFDGSSSCGGPVTNGICSSTSAIVGYSWNFGDGSTGGGRTTTHKYSAPGIFAVTLTVVNDRGVAASATQTIAVGSTLAPTAAFVFSPTAPSVGQTVVFNADPSKAAVGHTIVQYSWNFGDGATATGTPVSHSFATAGSYNVTLTVVDDTGQTGTSALSVTVK